MSHQESARKGQCRRAAPGPSLPLPATETRPWVCLGPDKVPQLFRDRGTWAGPA